MKKVFIILFVFTFCFMLIACNGNIEKIRDKNLYTSITTTIGDFQNTLLKIKQNTQSDLSKSEIAPINYDDISYMKVNIDTKRENFDGYVNKLEKLYENNLEVLNLNIEINDLRSKLNDCIKKSMTLANAIRSRSVEFSLKEKESIKTSLIAVQTSTKNVKRLIKNLTNAKQDFLNGSLKISNESLVSSQIFVKEQKSYINELQLAIKGFEGVFENTLNTNLNFVVLTSQTNNQTNFKTRKIIDPIKI